MNKQTSVLISIPVPPYGKLTSELVKYLLNVTNSPIPNVKVGVDIVEGKPIDSVRNNAVNKFLDSKYDYMLCIDSDIVPPSYAIPELLKWDKPLIGATCFSFQYDQPFAVIMNRTDNGEGGYEQSKNIGKERLIKCSATGAACLMIHRDVLEKMRTYLIEKNGKSMFFETLYRENGTLSWGQDFMFCEHAKEIGYDLYVDTAIICKHFVDGMDIKKINDLLVGKK